MTSRLALLPLLAVAACSAETSRVRDARDRFYQAISAFDQTGVRAVVAPDYVSVDRGRLFNLDSLITDVILLEQESLTVRYAFADSAVRVDPPLAWMVYLSRRILTRHTIVDTSYSLESATFRRDGGGWRLVLLHRTPLDGTALFEPAIPAPAPGVAVPADTAAADKRAKLRVR
jgi:hypothetical protein